MKKNWWWRWTVERPAAFGDWLWDRLVVKPADFLNTLTLRKVLLFIPIVLLVIMFAQTIPLDLAILFAGDTLMYMEALTIVALLAARGRGGVLLYIVKQMTVGALRAAVGAITFARRGLARARRLRDAVRARRPAGLLEKSDDERGSGDWLIAACASA